jgi:hypothetical protein
VNGTRHARPASIDHVPDVLPSLRGLQMVADALRCQQFEVHVPTDTGSLRGDLLDLLGVRCSTTWPRRS